MAGGKDGSNTTSRSTYKIEVAHYGNVNRVYSESLLFRDAGLRERCKNSPMWTDGMMRVDLRAMKSLIRQLEKRLS